MAQKAAIWKFPEHHSSYQWCVWTGWFCHWFLHSKNLRVVLILFVGHSVCLFFVGDYLFYDTIALDIPDERYEARECQPLSRLLPWLWSVCHSNRVLFARQLGRSVAQWWRQTGLDVQVLSLSRPHQGAFLGMWLAKFKSKFKSIEK